MIPLHHYLIVSAILFALGTAGAIAQNTPNEPKAEAAPKGPSSSGAVKEEKPTDPNSPNLFMCEDSDYVGTGGTSDNYVRILTPAGKVADFARNITQGFDESEVAGATFSPDGSTLFFNVQTPGFTVAVWGDWKAFKG